MMTRVIHSDILRFTSKPKLAKQMHLLKWRQMEQTIEKTKKETQRSQTIQFPKENNTTRATENQKHKKTMKSRNIEEI